MTWLGPGPSTTMLGGLLAFLFYTYLGYPLLLRWLTRRSTARSRFPGELPRVTVLIAAHDEARIIAATLDRLLASRYDADALEVVVVSDASSDGTDDLVLRFAERRVRLIRTGRRVGKRAALEKALQSVSSPIVVFLDASSLVDSEAIARMVEHFGDPRVGSVVGAKVVARHPVATSLGDGAYWSYDGMLRRLESRSGSSCVGVEGGLFAIRRALISLDFPDDVATDYVIGCEVHRAGYDNVFEAEARALEPASRTLGIEFRRKVRVVVRGIRAFVANADLLDPMREPRFFFQNVSHRLCRWLAPFALLALFVGCLFGPWTGWRGALLVGQALFYGIALIGVLGRGLGLDLRWAAIPAYFATVNLAAIVAWLSVFRRFRTWKPTLRTDIADGQHLDG